MPTTGASGAATSSEDDGGDVRCVDAAFERAKSWLGASSGPSAMAFAAFAAEESATAALRRRHPRLGLGATPRRRASDSVAMRGIERALTKSAARTAAERRRNETNVEASESESESEDDRVKMVSRGGKRRGGSVYDDGGGRRGKRR